MKTIGPLVFLALIACASGAADPLSDEQQSHIDGTVPTESAFEQLLRRDLRSYFLGQAENPDGEGDIEFQYLRKGPTQSGVAYPKYYLWVRVESGGRQTNEGAVRVAAIDKERFEVTHFLPAAEIAANPKEVGLIFPGPLIESILKRAGVENK